ncbi:EF-hand domain-containing protein [Amylibacter sp. SFDW26]|uniref:EF-hand domain-containing protein n=1 Tax=Amylibacter sp. SFDW26 TaxID=2652722 RepID=UPI0012615254|nr:EF-hand domain-containing protein [Amylibacter sp. SFDW26]KAB7613706.1 EF-hand domain-containing protein [Amylibacter sp. SFDW26]
MKKTILALAAVTFSTAAYAADFATVDADQDGAVSAEELTAAMPDVDTNTFLEADTDQNGTLSEAEMTAAIESNLLPAG